MDNVKQPKKVYSKVAVKTYLHQMFHLDEIINCKVEQLSHLRMMSQNVSGNKLNNTLRLKTQNDKVSAVVAKIIDLENSINNDIDNLLNLKKEIIEKIDGLESNIYRLLLNLRYVNLLTWEQVADKINYDYKHTHRLHDKALQEFNKKYDLTK